VPWQKIEKEKDGKRKKESETVEKQGCSYDRAAQQKRKKPGKASAPEGLGDMSSVQRPDRDQIEKIDP